MRLLKINLSKIKEDKHPDLKSKDYVIGVLKNRRVHAGRLFRMSFYPGGPMHFGLVLLDEYDSVNYLKDFKQLYKVVK